MSPRHRHLLPLLLTACSAFSGGDDGTTAGTSATARIGCDAETCTEGAICCEKDDGTHACTSRESCQGSDALAILCDDPSDCGGGECCLRAPDGYHVEAVSCGACDGQDEFRTCDPQTPACKAEEDCVPVASAMAGGGSSLMLPIFVCR